MAGCIGSHNKPDRFRRLSVPTLVVLLESTKYAKQTCVPHYEPSRTHLLTAKSVQRLRNIAFDLRILDTFPEKRNQPALVGIVRFV